MSRLWEDAVRFAKCVEDDYGLDAHEPLVAAVLAAAADDQGIVRGLGRAKIARLAGITQDNAKWSVNELRHAGWITVVGYDLNPDQSGKMICRYQLHVVPEAALEGAA